MGSEEETSRIMDKTCGYLLTPAPNLLALPDDVLMMIMSYLGPFDLLSFAKMSERLEELSQDHILWTVVDTRPKRMTLSDLTTIVEQLQPATRKLAARGFVNDTPMSKCISPAVLIELCDQCPALDTLILEEQYAEVMSTKNLNEPEEIILKQSPHVLHLKLFPKTLTSLSLKGCDFQINDHMESFFHDISVFLPLLKVLILSGCMWVRPHDFITIAKCNKLEELRMDGCYRLGDCMAYTSLAARFGFHSLKILDLRDTNMGDRDVSCFNRTTSLTHLYLECPSDPKHHLRNLPYVISCPENQEFDEDLSEMNTHHFIARIGWSEDESPEDHPVIVINRVGIETHDDDDVDDDDVDDDDDAPPAESQNEVPGPSGASAQGSKRVSDFRDLVNGPTVLPLTRSVSTLSMTLPGPSSSTEKSQKRKSECASSSSKRVKREDQNGHSEEEPAEEVNGTDSSSGSSDNSSDSSSEDCEVVEHIVYKRGKRLVQKLPGFSRPRGMAKNPFVTSAEPPVISDLCVMAFAEGNSKQNNDDGTANFKRKVVGGAHFWYVRLMYHETSQRRANLHTLVLRNFSGITDETLQLLIDHSSLRYLDVSGTSVTESGVLDFKLNRPDVEVISDFNVPF